MPEAIEPPSLDKRAPSVSSKRERLGGARAEFVAALGRHAFELRGMLDHLESHPETPAHAVELKGKLEAVAAQARLLRFPDIAKELSAARQRLSAAMDLGLFEFDDFAELRASFSRILELPWNEHTEPVAKKGAIRGDAQAEADSTAHGEHSNPSSPEQGMPADDRRAGEPESAQLSLFRPRADLAVEQVITVLVFGSKKAAEPFFSATVSARSFEVEVVEELKAAEQAAVALAPDVIVMDADLEGSKQAIEKLIQHPLVHSPIVAVGSFSTLEDAANLVSLGVTKAVPKPVAPEDLRALCRSLAAVDQDKIAFRPKIGTISVKALTELLTDELKRGLFGALTVNGQQETVDLGAGADVLAPLWGAVSKIRDVVTIRSEGRIAFDPRGPGGAFPLSPWFGTDTLSSRSAGNRSGSLLRLDGYTILVVDDDSAVVWFLAGILRAAGARVLEANDGITAFEVARQNEPDIVITDIVMPNGDGFELCRALKRDLVLRDVPVVLLSWKEDLLQRMREIGADADGYLKKTESAASIVQRTLELLWGKARLIERLRTSDEVKGRIDGLSMTRLIRLIGQHRSDSEVSVRDARHVYTLILVGGRVAFVERTDREGTCLRGPRAISELLSLGSGRFCVKRRSSDDEVYGLDAMEAQFRNVIARARAAQRLTSESTLFEIERIEFDRAALDEMRLWASGGTTLLLDELRVGLSPRALVLERKRDPRILEDVLRDAAARGAISNIRVEGDEWRFIREVDSQIALLEHSRSRQESVVKTVDFSEEEFNFGPVVMTALPPDVALLEPAREGLETATVAATLVPLSEGSQESELQGARSPSPSMEANEQDAAFLAENASNAVGDLGDICAAQDHAASPRTELRFGVFAARPGNEEQESVANACTEKRGPNRLSRMGLWLGVGLIGLTVSFAMRTRTFRPRELPNARATQVTASASNRSNPLLEDLPLPSNDGVSQSEGVLEVRALPNQEIFADGKLLGKSQAKVKVTARNEPYEIRVRGRSSEQSRSVLVRPGRLARIRFESGD